MSTVISMCGSDGTGLPSWTHGDALLVAGRRTAAARRRTATTPTRRSPPRRRAGRRCRAAVNGSAVAVDPRAERPQRVEHGAHRPLAGARVAVEADGAVGERRGGRHEPHDGAGQPAVDGRRRRAGRRARRPSRARRRRRSGRRARAGRRPSARCRGWRERRRRSRARRRAPRAAGRGWSPTSSPGTATRPRTGPAATGAGQGRAHPCPCRPQVDRRIGAARCRVGSAAGCTIGGARAHGTRTVGGPCHDGRMCGRYASIKAPEDLADEFRRRRRDRRRRRRRRLQRRAHQAGRRGRRAAPARRGGHARTRTPSSARCGCVRWGLVPSWSKDP